MLHNVKRMYTTHLQLGNHILFTVVADRLVQEKALTQMLFIVTFEDILFLEEAEEDHGLVQHQLDILFSHSSDAFF